ncbi:unnamed protein product, partial [marine sediment metagenome]
SLYIVFIELTPNMLLAHSLRKQPQFWGKAGSPKIVCSLDSNTRSNILGDV